ncbi:hypothetical protein [Flavicella sp.]|uniref:hypothetical protein n=1 Tax=Flavicella sp. TaxID=2957742 RepID=UPI00301B6648
MKIKITFITLLMFATSSIVAQFSLSGEFRPRTEYRNGFGNLKTEDQAVGFGTSTRIRLNAAFKGEGFTTYLSLQDVFVFGENRQLLQADSNNSFSIFEAWADIELGESYSAKLGRQMISYDDQRIMGSVGWAQQARTHDALLFKHKSNAITFDLGLAYNQNYDNAAGFVSSGNDYTTTGFFSYKTMQYIHANKKWNNFEASILVLNNGYQKYDANDADGVNNFLTYGTHLKAKIGMISLAANIYGQSGDITANQFGGDKNTDIEYKSAYLASIDATTNLGKFKVGIGFETISGDDDSTTEKESFFPVFGTNHKFNGFMDYFYVGNHANNLGLNDIHISTTFPIGKSKLMVKVLNFSTSEKLASGDTQLGTEVDLVWSYKIKPAVLFQAGYSQMFAADGMDELKVVSPQDTQNWAWAMITIKPKFL